VSAGPVSAADQGGSLPARELAAAVLGCAAGAGLALLTAGRAWQVVQVARPAPLPAATTAVTGSDLAPVLPALALVALAGAAALLATRASARVGVGVLLAGCGLGITVACGQTLAGRAGVAVGWAVACAFAGVVVATAGVATVVRGRRWPGMGQRYERAARPGAVATTTGAGAGAGYSALWWDAIDRGEDPTAGSHAPSDPIPGP
jgi:hypothetical protein